MTELRNTPRRAPSMAILRRQRDRCLEILNALDDTTLADLRRRAGEPAEQRAHLEDGSGLTVLDGYPTGAGVGRSGDIADPTSSAALADRILEDPVGDALTDLFDSLGDALGLLRDLDRRRTFVLGVNAHAHGRQSTLQGDCQCCGRPVAGTPNDRLRSGYCDACRMAWERAGRPERTTFELDRRTELAARGHEPVPTTNRP